jgi:hypothetical protein
VLSSLARQVEDAAQRAAKSAGIQDVSASAELSYQGEITSIRLVIGSGVVAAFSQSSVQQDEYQDVKEQVARALSIPVSLVRVEAEGS